MRLDASDIHDLEPVLSAVVRATFDRIEADRAKLADRLGFDEPSSAALLGVPRHVLRDCRLRGEISARKVGCKYIYSRQTLVDFLADDGGRQ